VVKHRDNFTFLNSVEFEVLTQVVIRVSVLCDITPCSSLKIDRHFGGKSLLHLQGPATSMKTDGKKSRCAQMDTSGKNHSSVGIAEGYEMGGRRSILGRHRFLLSFIKFRPILGPTQPPIQWVPRGISP
jgi:hypothetical protein